MPPSAFLEVVFPPPIKHRLFLLLDTTVILHDETYKFNVHYQFIVTATVLFSSWGENEGEPASTFFLQLFVAFWAHRTVAECISYVNPRALLRDNDYCNVILW